MKLPIDEQLGAVTRALTVGHVVIEAPPGAGKTTRVPPALLDAVAGEIWVTEPRRLAARMAARRVAAECREEVGGLVGYQVRFEEAISARTRIRFVTEGVLMRRIGSDPTLRGVGAVLFDEFHERHLPGDLALALLRETAATRRPDLHIGVMSATLEAAPVAEYLPGCTRIAVPGRAYPIDIQHAEEIDRRPLEVQVRAALRTLLTDGVAGDVLVFLPGAAEIRRAGEAVRELAEARDFEVVTLHGDLSPEAQDRAVLPGPRRKVILSTNVAESSVTIEGVCAVIDSGLARVPTYSPWTGLPGTRVAPVSQASAQQRAGRAGRTGPGRCVRLYTRHEYAGRPAHAAPEIERADLAELVLLLHLLGRDAASLAWLTAPPAAAVEAAETLLHVLGALRGGAITELGRRMWQLPVHPRLARLITAGQERGVAAPAAAAAALLGDRDPRPRDALGPRGEATYAGPSDVLDWVERWRQRRDIDRRALAGADQLVRRVRGAGGGGAAPRSEREGDEALMRALLSAFPDRVARRRRAGGAELLLSGGGAAELDHGSVVRHAPAELMVVVAAEERSGRTIARAVSAIEAEWLLEIEDGPLSDEIAVELDGSGERVEVVARMRYGKLSLDESRRPPRSDDEFERAAQLLAELVLARGVERVFPRDELAALLGRLAFVRRAFPERELPEVGDAAVATALAELCRGKTSLAELAQDDVRSALAYVLEQPYQPLLSRAAPERVELAGGRRAQVHYPADQTPWLASRLQDFFGMSATPRVAEGRVPLTLHLLAPNKRAVQVTQDLAGFWERHYPQIKRELARRYPRHAWPEDPTRVQPAMRPRDPRKRGPV